MFEEPQAALVAAALDEQVPGAAALGAVRYVERLLTALDHDPPRLWAGVGPWAADGGPEWIPLGPWERDAWQQRIDGWRAVYGRVARGDAEPGDAAVLHAHACEAVYGDPAYGGNLGAGGWQRIEFPHPLFPPRRVDQ
jgi:hypothetical protein